MVRNSYSPHGSLLMYFTLVFDLSKSKRLPFLSHPRFVELDIIPRDSINELHFLLHPLVISIQRPATLEYLKCHVGFHWLDVYDFMQCSTALMHGHSSIPSSLFPLALDFGLQRVDLNICLHASEEGVSLETVRRGTWSSTLFLRHRACSCGMSCQWSTSSYTLLLSLSSCPVSNSPQ
jgi:hypothetical protein